MPSVSSLADRSLAELGSGAHLATVLPSAVAILGTAAVLASRLYPWTDPWLDAGMQPVDRGVDSVVHVVENLGVAGAVVLAFTVVGGAVLLRPFQIAVVQVLEGYWRGGVISAYAIDRHQRRHSMAAARRYVRLDPPEEAQADDVARSARRSQSGARIKARAKAVAARYPFNGDHTMPTQLGNILRAAETEAGERYGLSTVQMYPRLYPHLSQPLGEEMRQQIDLLDAAAAFTLMFAGLTTVTIPLAARLDGWSLLPVTMAVAAVVSYRGACRVANNHRVRLRVAFDLHRFDMLTQMHERLPADRSEELGWNRELCRRLDSLKDLDSYAKDSDRRYSHGGPIEAKQSLRRRARALARSGVRQ